jgi:hypothetical protein
MLSSEGFDKLSLTHHVSREGFDRLSLTDHVRQ